ncbi:MAG: protoporphyrinogen oxidase [Verrucomicrobia bacterium]|nr:protoporphyrinogen oxidase [Verrucomicrobiota bacterium]
MFDAADGEMVKTAILGGGISGLSAAWYLLKKEPQANIVLYEKGPRLGGWIETNTSRGFTFERGPRTLARSRSPYLLQLIDELGLKTISSSGGKRYLWRQGKLRPIGSYWPSMLCAIARDLFAKRSQQDDESIASFASRRFGKRAAELFFDPMTLGVYAGDIHRLSIRSCFPTLWDWEQKEGSLFRGWHKRKKGPAGLFTLEGGLERLISELKRQLPIKIVTNFEVHSLDDLAADRIISALPAYEISRLTNIPLDLPYRSLWVVHLGFTKKHLKQKGFGYLVPSTENQPLLGMVWDSDLFGEEETTRLTAMIRAESADPIRTALDALQKHLEIKIAPDFIEARLAKNAIPQFEVGHAEKIAHFEKQVQIKFPHLSLAGNYFSGASLEACVQRSFNLK